MRKLLIILCCTICLSLPATAQETSIVIEETESHTVLKGLFKSVWARLKSLNPTAKQSANAEVYTAGIRCSVNTDTLLKPYWQVGPTRLKGS